VLAILERDSPETQLRVDLTDELEEFLEKGVFAFVWAFDTCSDAGHADGPRFIDQLFNVLRTKSYIPYSASSSSGAGAASVDGDDAMGSPSNASGSPRASRKRPLEDDSERPPPKGPRLGNYNNNNSRHQPGPVGMGMEGMSGHVNPHRQPGAKVFIPPDQMQGVCRDYHGQSAPTCSLSCRC
jgi:RNA-binding protein 26